MPLAASCAAAHEAEGLIGLKIAGRTDKGLLRSSNQDAYATGEMPGNIAWAVVCDGMGGARGGNIASSTAVKVISKQITSGLTTELRSSTVKRLLLAAIRQANQSIFELSKANELLKGMGTTVVAAVVCNNIAYIAHAGDSRAYKVTASGIQQLTRDHSMVQVLLEKGQLTPDEAKIHPKKNIITRALGVDHIISTDYMEEPLEDHEILLICTDGLTNYVEVEKIYRIMQSCDNHEFADRLVMAANENGGGDNITVVTISQ